MGREIGWHFKMSTSNLGSIWFGGTTVSMGWFNVHIFKDLPDAFIAQLALFFFVSQNVLWLLKYAVMNVTFSQRVHFVLVANKLNINVSYFYRGFLSWVLKYAVIKSISGPLTMLVILLKDKQIHPALSHSCSEAQWASWWEIREKWEMICSLYSYLSLVANELWVSNNVSERNKWWQSGRGGGGYSN